MSERFRRLGDLTCSFGYLGHAPVASGTFGALGAFALCLLIPGGPLLRGSFHFGLTVASLAFFFLLIGVPMGHWAERYYGRKDPGPFVLDEVMGLFVTLLRLDGTFPGWRELITAFVLFRVFDILKPAPARQFERLPGGWGIMLDDLVAGLYAWLMLWVLRDHLYW